GAASSASSRTVRRESVAHLHEVDLLAVEREAQLNPRHRPVVRLRVDVDGAPALARLLAVALRLEELDVAAFARITPRGERKAADVARWLLRDARGGLRADGELGAVAPRAVRRDGRL